MNTLIVLIIIGQVVYTLWRKRAAQQAEQEADLPGEEMPAAEHPKASRTQTSGQVRGATPAYRAEAPEAKAQSMRGKPFVPGSEAEVHEEHSRTRRDLPNGDRGEHEASPFSRPKPKAPDAPRSAPPASASPSRNPGKGLGKDLLDQLAKELGLPAPDEILNRPPSRPTPAKPAPANAAAKAPEKGRPKEAVYSERNYAERTYTERSGRDDNRRRPIATQAAVSASAASSKPLDLPPLALARPEDVAAGMVLQSILGEAPGLRLWQQSRRARPKPSTST